VSDTPSVIPEDQARQLFTQVVSAVQFMHASGVCHRDLKLENVLLSHDHKHAWLCDWGFGCRWSLDVLRKESCGSVHYASPELLVGEGYIGNEIDVGLCFVLRCGSVGELSAMLVVGGVCEICGWIFFCRARKRARNSNDINNSQLNPSLLINQFNQDLL
jgi:serine/threonine protein kinase